MGATALPPQHSSNFPRSFSALGRHLGRSSSSGVCRTVCWYVASLDLTHHRERLANEALSGALAWSSAYTSQDIWGRRPLEAPFPGHRDKHCGCTRRCYEALFFWLRIPVVEPCSGADGKFILCLLRSSSTVFACGCSTRKLSAKIARVLKGIRGVTRARLLRETDSAEAGGGRIALGCVSFKPPFWAEVATQKQWQIAAATTGTTLLQDVHLRSKALATSCRH